MSSQREALERINQLGVNLTKYSTKEQVEFHLPFMRWALCFTRLVVKAIHGVDLDDIKDDTYRVRNLIRDVHPDKDYLNLEFYLLDKYDLWDEYLRIEDKNEDVETSRTKRQ